MNNGGIKLFILISLFGVFICQSQTQIGDAFLLTDFFQRAGSAMSINESGNRIAVGQPKGKDDNGYVEVFDYSGSLWRRVGSRLANETAGERFGASVSMNASGTRLIVGALKSDVNGVNSGYAKIYEYEDVGNGDFDWVEIAELQGDEGDEFGASVSMDASGNVVAIGSPYDDETFENSGSVRIFTYEGGNWIEGALNGSTIRGSEANENIGRSVRINSDASKIVLRGNTVVRLFEINIINTWEQKGTDIAIANYDADLNSNTQLASRTEEYEHENTLGISSSKDRIVVGDPYANNAEGEVSVYELINNNWQQLGGSIVDNNIGSRLGHAVSISSDGNRIGIGNLPTSNHTNNNLRRVYDYDHSNNTWTQFGSDINCGCVPNLQNVLLNSKGNVYGFASVNNGFIRAYRVSELATITTDNTNSIEIFKATIEGTITSDGREDITERGFVFSATDSDPKIGDSGVTQTIDPATDLGTFNKAISDLSSETTYYYRAYARNLHGTTYGNVLTFTTLAIPPITTNIGTVEGTRVTLGGTISEIVEGEITERGIIYATHNNNLEIGTSGVTKVEINSNNTTFSELVEDLNVSTEYYTRSYLKVDFSGTVYTFYGDEKSFVTENIDSPITFTGTIDTDWNTANNWSLERLPIPNDDVIISNEVVISSSTTSIVKSITINNSGIPITIHGSLTADNLNIQGNKNVHLYGDLTINNLVHLNVYQNNDLLIYEGGSFILHGTSSGNGLLRYNRSVTANHWNLISTPFKEHTIFEYVNAENSIVSSGNNHAYAPYNNAYTGIGDVWDYIQTSEIPSSFPSSLTSQNTLIPLKGYATSISGTTVKFTGTPQVNDVSIAITAGTTDSYNLIGNPYPSYLDANSILNANTGVLEEQTLWFWDSSTSSYKAYNLLHSYQIPPTNGFFVKSASDGGTFNITASMQKHEEETVSTHPQIELSVSDGTNTKKTNIYYSDDGTTGFENGYDSRIFEGYKPNFPENLTAEALNVYTALVSDSTEKLVIQTLPNSNHESMTTPIGVKASSGTTLTFSAASFNFTIPVYIEDRQEGTFHLLDENNSYQVSLTNNLDGVGRFYAHAKSGIKVSPKVFLQGPYDSESGLMNDHLREAGFIPNTSPYSDQLSVDSTVFDVTGDNAIVDWVYVELRDKADITSVVAATSAFVQRDGDVVAIDGSSPVSFNKSSDDYYISISHRNHVAIATDVAMNLTGFSNMVDFTNVNSLRGAANAVIDLTTGVYGLYAGDLDGNSQIQNIDIAVISAVLGTSGYYDTDLDMNGQIQISELNNILIRNIGKGRQY